MNTLFFLLVLTDASQVIKVKGFTNIASIAKAEQFVFMYDHYQKTILKTDHQGNILHKFDQRGSGPSEFMMPYKIRHIDNELWVVDVMKRRYLVFNNDFSFKQSIPVNGLPRDVLKNNDQLFLLYPSYQNKLIHEVDDRYEVIRSFGPGLADTKLLGFELGHVQHHQNSIIFIHHFKPLLYQYSTDGDLEMKKTLPGHDDKTWIDFDIYFKRQHQPSDYINMALIQTQNNIWILTKIFNNHEHYLLYQFNSSTNKFSSAKKIHHKKLHFDGDKSLYIEAIEHDSTILTLYRRFSDEERENFDLHDPDVQ